MTTKWNEFLTELRSDLEDSGDKRRWTDTALYIFTKDAVRDYSLHWPMRVDRQEMTLSGTYYPLPADFVGDISVECPENRFLERRISIPGRRYGQFSRPLYYFIEGVNLYLGGSPLEGDKVLLTYYATHPIPTSETDDTFVFTVPDRDLELLRLYVRAQVHGQMRSKQSRLDRFDVGGGRRDDNPLLPETNYLMREYDKKVAERHPPSVITLYRPGLPR